MRTPTEDEAELLHHRVNKYWEDFSALVNTTLEQVPEDLRAELAMRLQEKSSVYGRADAKYPGEWPPGHLSWADFLGY